MNFSLSPDAEAELAEAAAYYAQNVSRGMAERFVAMFEQKAKLLAQFPGMGTKTSRDRRAYPIGRYRYSIIYRVDDDNLRIIAIAAHARRPKYWRGRT